MADEPQPHDAEGTAAEEPGTALERVQAPSSQALGAIIGSDDPDVLLEAIGRLSTSLKKFVEEQGLAVDMGGGRQHVEVGAWQALGHLLGTLGITAVHAETVWTRPMAGPNGEILRVAYTATVKRWYSRNDGGGLKSETTYDVNGIEAWEGCVQVCTGDGIIVGKAEAMCSRYEATWSTREDYALRSMAETRAESRAFRRGLGFFMQAAGYSPTPREEMPPTEPELPAFALAADDGKVKNMVAALAFLLQEQEPGERVEAFMAELRTALAEIGVPDDDTPRVLTFGILKLATFMRDLQAAAHASAEEPAGEAPPAAAAPLAAVPDPPAEPAGEPEIPFDGEPTEAVLEPTLPPGTVDKPRLSGDEDRDIEKLREVGCVCARPLEPGSWRQDCPIKSHSRDAIPF